MGLINVGNYQPTLRYKIYNSNNMLQEFNV